jgi:hypothetical protein
MSDIDLGALTELLQQVAQVLPSVPTDNQQLALDQFTKDSLSKSITILRDAISQWSQGDILYSVPFIIFTPQGEPKTLNVPGMIITSSCDLDRKPTIVFCPCFSMSALPPSINRKDVQNNLNYQFLYLGKDFRGEELIVDFNLPSALPRERILQKLENNSTTRAYSLTQIGWYLFITKFSLNYLRSDDSDTMSSRAQ